VKLKSEDLLQTLAWAAAQEISIRRRERLQWWRSLMTVTPYALGRFKGMGPSYFAEWRGALKAEIAARRERGQW